MTRIDDGETLQRWAAQVARDLPQTDMVNPFRPGTDVFRVGQRMFMMTTTHPDGRPIVNVKCEPEQGRLLRENTAGIQPGYHMNKRHWITLDAGPGLDTELVTELVTSSYLLVVSNLPRRLRPHLPDHLRE